MIIFSDIKCHEIITYSNLVQQCTYVYAYSFFQLLQVKDKTKSLCGKYAFILEHGAVMKTVAMTAFTMENRFRLLRQLLQSIDTCYSEKQIQFLEVIASILQTAVTVENRFHFLRKLLRSKDSCNSVKQIQFIEVIVSILQTAATEENRFHFLRKLLRSTDSCNSVKQIQFLVELATVLQTAVTVESRMCFLRKLLEFRRQLLHWESDSVSEFSCLSSGESCYNGNRLSIFKQLLRFHDNSLHGKHNQLLVLQLKLQRQLLKWKKQIHFLEAAASVPKPAAVVENRFSFEAASVPETAASVENILCLMKFLQLQTQLLQWQQIQFLVQAVSNHRQLLLQSQNS